MVFKATHRGYLNVAGKQIPCAVLENGKRVVTQTGLFEAFDKSRRGSLINENGVPSILEAKNLQALITPEVAEKFQVIPYYHTNGKVANGYDADLITEVCSIYIEAKEKNILLNSQNNRYERSMILIRSLAKVGITALIDEATGYQEDRESQALQKLLEQYIAKDLMQWQKRFPNTYYKEIFKLHNWEYNAQSNLRPAMIGKFTNKYVYDLFPKEVMDEIRNKNPMVKSENTSFRRNRIHQYLTTNIGLPQLDNHITRLITIMRISKTVEQFEENFQIEFEEELNLKQQREEVAAAIE
jgi:hypothetical protein